MSTARYTVSLAGGHVDTTRAGLAEAVTHATAAARRGYRAWIRQVGDNSGHTVAVSPSGDGPQIVADPHPYTTTPAPGWVGTALRIGDEDLKANNQQGATPTP